MESTTLKKNKKQFRPKNISEPFLILNSLCNFVPECHYQMPVLKVVAIDFTGRTNGFVNFVNDNYDKILSSTLM